MSNQSAGLKKCSGCVVLCQHGWKRSKADESEKLVQRNVKVGWHARRFFPWFIAREDNECDVDEAMWPHRQDRRD